MNVYQTLMHRTKKEVPQLIALKREGAYWDFKREWHEKTENLVHDILCLANNLESSVSYLIIGIDEQNDFQPFDLDRNETSTRRNSQDITDLLSKTFWGNSKAPFTVVLPLTIGNSTTDVLVIVSRREDMPYYLAKPCGNVRPWIIYTRRSDCNTAIDEGANWSEVQAIWRHHFSLDESPLDRVSLMLRDKAHWNYLTQIYGSEDKYYQFSPEFTIHHSMDENRDAYEYYLLNQTDPEPGWYDIKICYYQTTIYDTLGMALDGGRYFSPVPERAFIRWTSEKYQSNPDLTYCYFVRNSIDWDLHIFFYDAESYEARIAREKFMNMVVIFDTEEEHSDFDSFLSDNKNRFDEIFNTIREPYVPVERLENYSQEGISSFSTSMRAVPVLKEMLEEFRAMGCCPEISNQR